MSYHPALDGVRALSIIAVLLYHGGVSWAQGGFLGVELFFVLSGFLITSLLIAEWSNTSRIQLSRFWIRRGRRLLPALFALLLVIGMYYTLAGSLRAIPGFKGSALATLMYVGNWHQIASGSNYFVASGPMSPVQHTWSLAIEEQFYLVWPVLLAVVFWLVSKMIKGGQLTRRRSLQTMLILTVAGAFGAAIDVALLYRGGRGLERVYYGTDTRATGLLTGATLAIVLVLYRDRPSRVLSRQQAGLLTSAALLLLGGLFMAMHFASGASAWLFPWGLLGTDVAVATLIASVTLLPSSLLAGFFSVRPLRGIGQISYGLYLWHLPCFVWLDERATGLHGVALLMLRVTSTFAIAALSYAIVEQPIRQRRVPTWLLRPLVPAAGAGSIAAVLAAGAVGAQVPGRTFAPVFRAVAARYIGASGPCTVRVGDNALYRTVPLAPARTGGYIFHWILRHAVDWNGGGYPNSAVLTFHTCPPHRVLIIGDSIAFTAGVPMLHDENQYGVELANAAVLGCAFGTRGEIQISGVFTRLPAECPGVLQRWQHAEERFRPQAVVIELGYRDEFDWSWHSRAVHLGQPDFDAYVRGQVIRFVHVLGQDGARILFLTVPYVQPPPLPNGDPAPAGSTARHAIINSILESVARTNPTQVRVLDIDTLVSPGSRYAQTVHGNACRFDGIHFTIYCASLLQPYVLAAARNLIAMNPSHKTGDPS